MQSNIIQIGNVLNCIGDTRGVEHMQKNYTEVCVSCQKSYPIKKVELLSLNYTWEKVNCVHT